MSSSSDGPTAADEVRCNVCGRTFEDGEALERHLRDQGLLW